MQQTTRAVLLAATSWLAACADAPVGPTVRPSLDASRATLPGQQYSIVVESVIDLDPTASQSFARDINESGWIVGARSTSSSPLRSTLWKGGPSARVQLGQVAGSASSEAIGINDLGTVVGDHFHFGFSGAFLWTEAAGVSDIMASSFTLPSGSSATYVQASDINTLGTIIGTVGGPSSSARYPFTRGSAGTQVLEPCGGDGWGHTINDAEWIGGRAEGSGSAFLPFVRAGSSCNSYNKAGAIRRLNNNGVAAGDAWQPGVGQQAIRWSQSMGYTRLQDATDTRESVAYGINTGGWIVGLIGTAEFNGEPFVYHSKVGIVMLPDLRSSSCLRTNPLRGVAYAINDSKWAVGVSRDCFGKQHATLWKLRMVVTSPPGPTQ